MSEATQPDAAAAAAEPAATMPTAPPMMPARDHHTIAEDGLPYPVLGSTVAYTVPGGGDPDLYENGVRPGERLPAIVCRILPITPECDTKVNLRVLVDGPTVPVHVANVQRGPGVGKYQPLQATVHK